MQLYWKNVIPDIIEEIKSLRRNRLVLGEFTRVFNIFEFSELASYSKNDIIWLDYLDCSEYLDEDRKEGRCGGCKKREASECWGEYVYFRDVFKIIVHITVAPIAVHRRLPMIIVDKRKDGSYSLSDSQTVKYPAFYELFYDVIEERSADRERYILFVDVEEVLHSVNDIENALCCFKVSENSIEVWDAHEGMLLWGAMLEEAYNSGKCTVDSGFY